MLCKEGLLARPSLDITGQLPNMWKGSLGWRERRRNQRGAERINLRTVKSVVIQVQSVFDFNRGQPGVGRHNKTKIRVPVVLASTRP